jgi:hypothetical protein
MRPKRSKWASWPFWKFTMRRYAAAMDHELRLCVAAVATAAFASMLPMLPPRCSQPAEHALHAAAAGCALQLVLVLCTIASEVCRAPGLKHFRSSAHHAGGGSRGLGEFFGQSLVLQMTTPHMHRLWLDPASAAGAAVGLGVFMRFHPWAKAWAMQRKAGKQRQSKFDSDVVQVYQPPPPLPLSPPPATHRADQPTNQPPSSTPHPPATCILPRAAPARVRQRQPRT